MSTNGGMRSGDGKGGSVPNAPSQWLEAGAHPAISVFTRGPRTPSVFEGKTDVDTIQPGNVSATAG